MATETFNPFQPAVKSQIKARVALDGPTGSGKTWTALKWATVLAGPDGDKRRDNGMARISLVDTERRSASLYAPHFTFDVADFAPPYDVARLIETINAAEAAGYAVCVIDSWSHFWEGEGGVLDEVDAAAKRSGGGNSFAGWKHGTPLQRHMVDVILGLDMDVIVTMRSKMEYVLTEYQGKDGKSRSKPEKVGMAPVQRAGVEYEFQIVGDMDLDHRITISKSRCDVLADRIVQPDRESEAAKEFRKWLDDGEPVASPDMVRQHVAAVVAAPAGVAEAMTVWMNERGMVMKGLSESDLAALNAHLADLLLDQAEIAAVGGDDPGPASGADEETVGVDASDTEPPTVGEPEEPQQQLTSVKAS